MTEQLVEVKYKCLHQSCQVFCKKGTLNLDENEFSKLSSFFDDKSLFKSPKNVCRLGFSQIFKIVNKDESNSGNQNSNKLEVDPIDILVKEHDVVMKLLDEVENYMRIRDVEKLWVSTAALKNELTLHSLEKEEEALFPLLEKVSSSIISYVGIMTEDHREVVSLINSFRLALIDDKILDGIGNSFIVNLRNHIAKENGEFFEAVHQHLSLEDKKSLLIQMNKLEKAHIPIEAGDRAEQKNSKAMDGMRRVRAVIDEDITIIREQGNDVCCH